MGPIACTRNWPHKTMKIETYTYNIVVVGEKLEIEKKKDRGPSKARLSHIPLPNVP